MVAPVSADGTVCIYAKSETNVIVDLAGWFSDSSFCPLSTDEARGYTRRDGTGAPAMPILDTDGDGISDDHDVFPIAAGESRDTDGDRIGDNTDDDDDDDDDGDGIADSVDPNPLLPDGPLVPIAYGDRHFLNLLPGAQSTQVFTLLGQIAVRLKPGVSGHDIAIDHELKLKSVYAHLDAAFYDVHHPGELVRKVDQLRSDSRVLNVFSEVIEHRPTPR